MLEDRYRIRPRESLSASVLTGRLNDVLGQIDRRIVGVEQFPAAVRELETRIANAEANTPSTTAIANALVSVEGLQWEVRAYADDAAGARDQAVGAATVAVEARDHVEGAVSNRALTDLSNVGDFQAALANIKAAASLTTRAALVAATLLFPADSIVRAGGYSYVKDGGTDIADLPGWSPQGEFKTPEQFGAVSDGIADDAPAVLALIRSGGRIYFPEGRRLFRSTLEVLPERDIDITMHPRAVLVAGPIDGMGIKIWPAAAVMDAGFKLRFSWIGGKYDYSAIRRSTVHPFSGIYAFNPDYPTRPHFPPANQGASNVCDALSFHGSYQPSGQSYRLNGIASVTIRDVHFYAGKHFLHGGGDSAIFPEGIDNCNITECRFDGCVDAGVYVSGANDGAPPPSRYNVSYNYLENCALAIQFKRGPQGCTASGNTIINCIRGISAARTGTGKMIGGEIRGNYFERCSRAIELYWAEGWAVIGNYCRKAGAKTYEGTVAAVGWNGMDVSPDVPSAVRFDGANKNIVIGNVFEGVIPELKSYGIDYAVRMNTGNDGVPGHEIINTQNIIANNICDGWMAFYYEAFHGEDNLWSDNPVYNETAPSVGSTIGKGSRTRRFTVDNRPLFSSAVFGSGATTSPAIRRSGAEGTGIGFDAAGETFITDGTTRLLRVGTSLATFAVRIAFATDNTLDICSPSNRARTLYAGSPAINTSDEREKQDIRPIDEAEAAVGQRLKNLIRCFRFKDAVALKGDGARLHFGVVAQEVRDAFEAEGLDGFAYGVLCFDTWDEEPEIVEVLEQPPIYDENGVMISEAVEYVAPRPYRAAGERFGVRYDELFAMVLASI
ncbi:tail fiber domain-containing protein [Methylopila sp. M107]|uniref:tail fiber domain-containing protein n=1 Tax=Methylopila sp. M107 TaxID=1101190 RepID=UPI00036D428F|nr:tail fiber domain-containing protein [Methylopila sp. M107]